MADQDCRKLEPESAYVKRCRLKPVVSEVEPWAALIKAVYKADPLKCLLWDFEYTETLRQMERCDQHQKKYNP